uniref:G_PROTEIN_RECEP_F1_2 domain-containing protein n=1 Tax=Rhabditophanes sp. KR3021 TaxID=114890 RepID=A0AC35TP38_9BILA
MVPDTIAFTDSNYVSTDIIANDIFTYEKTYTKPIMPFLTCIPQVVCPISSIIFSLLILKKINQSFDMSKIHSNSNKQQKLLTYSLLSNSLLPAIGTLPNTIFFAFITYGIEIPRFCWNLADCLTLIVGGITPSCMVFFIPAFAKPFRQLLGSKKRGTAVSVSMIQTGSRNGKKAKAVQDGKVGYMSTNLAFYQEFIKYTYGIEMSNDSNVDCPTKLNLKPSLKSVNTYTDYCTCRDNVCNMGTAGSVVQNCLSERKGLDFYDIKDSYGSVEKCEDPKDVCVTVTGNTPYSSIV